MITPNTNDYCFFVVVITFYLSSKEIGMSVKTTWLTFILLFASYSAKQLK